MGYNKLLLEHDGKTIIEHVLETVCGFTWKDIIVAVAEPSVEQAALNYPVRIIHNSCAHLGQSQSVIQSVRASRDSAGWFFVSADMPLLDDHIVNAVREAIEKNNGKIVAARYKYRNGQPVYFPQRYYTELISLQGDVGGRQIIREHPEDIEYVDFGDIRQGMDMDTPEDYRRLRNE